MSSVLNWVSVLILYHELLCGLDFEVRYKTTTPVITYTEIYDRSTDIVDCVFSRTDVCIEVVYRWCFSCHCSSDVCSRNLFSLENVFIGVTEVTQEIIIWNEYLSCKWFDLYCQSRVPYQIHLQTHHDTLHHRITLSQPFLFSNVPQCGPPLYLTSSSYTTPSTVNVPYVKLGIRPFLKPPPRSVSNNVSTCVKVLSSTLSISMSWPAEVCNVYVSVFVSYCDCLCVPERIDEEENTWAWTTDVFVWCSTPVDCHPPTWTGLYLPEAASIIPFCIPRKCVIWYVVVVTNLWDRDRLSVKVSPWCEDIVSVWRLLRYR